MIMAGMTLQGRKGDVFRSVFPPSTALQPTPDTEFTAPGQPFGGLVPFAHSRSQPPVSAVRDANPPLSTSAAVDDQVTFDRAWSTATRYLALPLDSGTFDLRQVAPLPPPPQDFFQALKDVLWTSIRLPGADNTDDLVEWYSQQVRWHFLNHVLDLLKRVSHDGKLEEVLPISLRILDQTHHLYRHGLSFIARTFEDHEAGSSKVVVERFRRDLHAIVSSFIPDRLLETLKVILVEKVHFILQIQKPSGENLATDALTSREESDQVAETERGELLSLVERLQAVGLGGNKLQTTFAEVMNDAMSTYVDSIYSGVWTAKPAADGDNSIRRDLRLSTQEFPAAAGLIPRLVNNASPSQCVRDLCEWIENRYSRLVVEILSKLEKINVAWVDVEKWKEMSIGRLAGLRTHELFDMVVDWPNSDGGLDDLRTAVTTPQRRLQLTDVFSANLHQQLLHPGVSTLQILRTYISMIWSFHSLDHSKVLLDRVAYPLQLYLCSRDDTVKIIITGLLSDSEDASGKSIQPGGDKLVELAVLLNRGSDQGDQRADEDLDWNDMDWVPDPVDAGPGYKRSKSADIIGTLIGVLGSQDVFIKEFQNIVGENLLKHEGEFEKEMKLLELLKSRFGEAPLQSCEVMVKDIQDSRRVDKVIRQDQSLDPSQEEIIAAKADLDMADEERSGPEGFFKPSLHAKILSRLFWPQLHDESFKIPESISKLQERYEQGFESLKTSRKLTWLHALGQATVELQLEDRVVFEEVHTWQAAVILAFSNDTGVNTPSTYTVHDLMEHLEMDEALVRSALTFWVGKMVLQEVQKDRYIVLETLNQDDRDKSTAQAAAAAATDSGIADGALLATNDEMTTEKMAIYWQFIQGMLKNSASQMPLQKIAMMLKMLVVDGFPYSNEDLQEFLGRKVTAGELELVAGKYKLKK